MLLSGRVPGCTVASRPANASRAFRFSASDSPVNDPACSQYRVPGGGALAARSAAATVVDGCEAAAGDAAGWTGAAPVAPGPRAGADPGDWPAERLRACSTTARSPRSAGRGAG